MDSLDINGYNDFQWVVGLNRCILKMIGLWPTDSNDTHEVLFSKFRRLFNIVMIFMLTIPTLMALIRVSGDMILVIDNMQHTLAILIIIMKVAIMWAKKKVCYRAFSFRLMSCTYTRADIASITIAQLVRMLHLMLLINMIMDDWMKTKVEEERNVMLQQARISRTITICGGIAVAGALIFAFILPCFGLTMRRVTNLTDSGKPLPIPTYYLYDVSKSPQYEITVLMQGISLILLGLSYTAVDSFLGLLVLHICGQLENLHVRLANLGKRTDYKKAVKYNVNDHVRLIRSIQLIDNIFHLMMLGMFFLFGILFCLQGFQVINLVNEGNQLSILQMISFLFVTLLHTGLYCVVGELIVTQSERVHRAVYESVWYNIDPKMSRDLILIMLCANKSLHLTAGKIFPLTIATFGSLLKTSASYITVLLAK